MPEKLDDFTPVIRGRTLTANQLRTDVDGLDHIDSHSELDLQIVRLLALNPTLKATRFGSLELSRVDDATKLALLREMTELLGITAQRTVR